MGESIKICEYRPISTSILNIESDIEVLLEI